MSNSTALPETVGETAYRRIRTDIIFGRLQPGQKLKLEKISDIYGTSISTLRELLNRLSSQGLIIAEGQRGFEVTPVSAEEFRQLAAMRLLLEGHAIEQSFAIGDLDWEGQVVSTHHKLAVLERRMLAGDRPDQQLWKRCDWDFHHALISASGSKVLLDTHAAVYDRYLRYQMIAVVFRGAIAAQEHQALLESALARDAPRAQIALSSHINDCVEHAINQDTAGIFTKPRQTLLRSTEMAKSNTAAAAMQNTPNLPASKQKRARKLQVAAAKKIGKVE